ncbi:MAG TPA: hypothetical protein VLS88_16245 [Polyangiales bacterium]|nr:hypothetical protein [Polyangiales bacterium]
MAVIAASMLACSTVTAFAESPRPEEPEPIVLAHGDSILGHWQRGEGEAIIEIRHDAGVYRGVIIWSQRRPETVGTEVFRELRYDPKKRAWEGRAYSIDRGREVRIDIVAPERDELELTAHVLIFKRRVGFKRVPSSEAARRTAPEL